MGHPLRRHRVWLACALAASLFAGSAAAQSGEQTFLLVIGGVSGDETFAKQFHTWATAIVDHAKKGKIPESHIKYLGEKPALDPARIVGRSTRENVRKAIADIAAAAKRNDEVFIILIGHGTRQGAFDLPGPNLTVVEWEKLLDKLSTQRVVFVNTSSASGAFLPAIAGPGRTIVTATKTGAEDQTPRFGQFFIEAFGDEAADRDRNGSVSVLEAFDYAKNKVVKSYEQAGLLMPEHAVLDDGSDGKFAAMLFLAAGSPSLPGVDTSDPEMRRLVADRDVLDRRIAELRLAKPKMDEAKYEEQLDDLLTELAVKTRAIRDLQAKKDRK